MKIGFQHVKAILLFTLITSNIYMTPVIAGDDLICTEAQYVISSLNSDQTKTVLACADTFDLAKESMNTLKTDYPDLIITHSTSKSPEKIIAATRAIATSFPQRRRDGTANAAIMYIYRNQNFSGDSTYMNAYRDMAYYDTINYNPTTSTGAVLMQISGFTGYTYLDQIDIIPMIYLENNWLISLGGNSYTGSLSVYQIRPRMNEYRTFTNSTYNVREIVHETFSFSSGSSLGVYVYGQAPDWLPDGTYYSWDSIHYYTDRSMTQPVNNGDAAGEYYNYYQYLPLRSSSNLTARHLDDYLIALGFTKKAEYYGEPNASAMFDEGKSFIDGQLKHGANALLVYALGLHESGRGTSRLSIEKNNIFGWGAVDSNPSDAYLFESVSASVAEHMGRNLRGYLSVDNYRFFGSVLGNKNNGFNTKYASDPYWGNKVAGWAYRIDRYFGFKDYNYYTLAILPEASNVSVKKSADSASSTMFVIPSRTVQRSVLVNRFHETSNGTWASVMSTQPITLTDSVVMFNQTASDITVYEWFKSIGYIPSNDLQLIYPGNGITKIPMVYDAKKFDEEPVAIVDTITLNEAVLSFSGIGVKPGLSVPYPSVASYQVSFVDEADVSISRPLISSDINADLNIRFNDVRFDYKGASFNGAVNVDDFPAGKYKLILNANFNILSDIVYFAQPLVSELTLPELINHQGRSYEVIKDDIGVLYLVVEDVEVVILKGDVNGDSKISITDLVMLHLTISGVNTFEEFINRNADMNSDGKISITDLVMLHLLIAGIEY